MLHSSNPTPFQSYNLPMLHSSNLTLFQSYTLPILHPSNPTLFQSYTLPILHQSYTLSIIHPSNLKLFQSYTFPILLFQSYILPILHSYHSPWSIHCNPCWGSCFSVCRRRLGPETWKLTPGSLEVWPETYWTIWFNWKECHWIHLLCEQNFWRLYF